MCQCFTQDWWLQLLPWSLLAIVFYVIGYPVVSALLVFKQHDILLKPVLFRKQWETLITEITYSKKQEFKEKCEYWHVLVSMRQFALTVIQLFFTGYTPLQVNMMCLVFLAAIIFQMHKLPYSSMSLNHLETTSLASSMVVLIHVSEFTDAQEDAFSVIIILIAVGATCSVAYGLIVHSHVMYQDAKKKLMEHEEILKTIKTEDFLDVDEAT